MAVLRTFINIIIGIVFGIVGAVALSPAFAAFNSDTSNISTYVFAFVFVLIIALCAFAPTIRRGFGRGFLTVGSCFILLPISTLLLSGMVTNDMINDTAAVGGDVGSAAVGGTIATGLLTGASAFFGIILGGLFLIIGLILALGGRREVIVVENRVNRE